jgi:hypothetical protein
VLKKIKDMSKKTKAQKAAVNIFPEKVWMEQIGYVNPYHKEREGFTLCWEQLKTKFLKLYKDACKSYNKALQDAQISGEGRNDDTTYHEGKKNAYLVIIEELMCESELKQLMKRKDEEV